ncbi:MAG: hypothetical protein ACR2KB_10885 [Chitinophagaceae bacterium]
MIKLSGDQLKKYAGEYILEDGRKILITYAENGLIEGRFSPKNIFPYKDNNFFVEGSFEEFEFLSNEMNEITGIILRNRKEVNTGKKIK